MKPLVVGLTGGIGSGKSAAADMFGALGAAIVDADALAHELTAPGGAAMAAIRAAFGDQVVDARGALDRAAMRRIAFAYPTARGRLERILHPMIHAESDARGQAALAAGAPYLMLVIPLLVEKGNPHERVDRVAVVDCPEDLQVARVMARSKLGADEVRRIMAAQASRAQRLAVADDVIPNEGDLRSLQDHVDALHRKYMKISGK